MQAARSIWRSIFDHPFWVTLQAARTVAPRTLAFALVLAVGRGTLPVVLFWTVSILAGSALGSGVDISSAAALVAGVYLLNHVADPLMPHLSRIVGRAVDSGLQRQLMEASLRPRTVAHLDTPAFREATAVARDWESSPHPPVAAVQALVMIVATLTIAITSIAVLATFAWWAPLVLAAGWLLLGRWGTRMREGPMLARVRGATPLRRAAYLRDLQFEAASAREARLFGLGRWLRAGAESQWTAAMSEIWRARSATAGIAVWTLLILLGGHVLVFGTIVTRVIDGSLDVPQAVFFVQLGSGVSNLWIPWFLVSLREGAAPLPVLARVTQARSDLAAEARLTGALQPAAPVRSVVLEGLTYRYPGGDRDILADLDLTIHAGRSLAIVGANGAGKTTLIRLLAGLMEPTAGRIVVDGVDLRAVDPAAWQPRVAAIFQDFVRYPFSARDNIVLGGDLTHATDSSPAVERALERAVERALARPVLGGLPKGLETTLSREFGGLDLSGGQWQRIALARAMYAVERGARLLVLDEPTAHLDIRAEAELFDRFLEVTAGLTTILISHRFSSVRHADRIVVLEAGRIVEDGTHAELLRSGGRYAEMFRLQARHFTPAHG